MQVGYGRYFLQPVSVQGLSFLIGISCISSTCDKGKDNCFPLSQFVLRIHSNVWLTAELALPSW